MRVDGCFHFVVVFRGCGSGLIFMAGERVVRRQAREGGARGGIVRERVEKLLALAREFLEEDEASSKRFVQIARRLAMRHREKLGSRLFCKKCNAVFVQGKTVKSRVQGGKVTWTCTRCGSRRVVGVAGRKAGKWRVPKSLLKVGIRNL